MGLDIAAVSHVGRIRKNNEDAYLISSLDGDEPLINARIIQSPSLNSGLLLAVADGMGGAAAGEIASREGLACLAMYLFGHWARFPGHQSSERALIDSINGAVKEASDSIIRYSYEDKTSRGMGTTLTSVILWNKHAYVSQIGDSRAYLLRNRKLNQITDDQTLVNNMIMSGAITPEQARIHPHRNMITQALGAPKPIKASVSRIPIFYGDKLILCTDGLHGELENADIEAIGDKDVSCRMIVEELLASALSKGGKDNITIIVARVDDKNNFSAGASEPIEIQQMDEVEKLDKTGIITRLGKFLVGKT